MNQNAIDVAERAILSYLAQNPSSADTTEGVHHWWISGEPLPGHMDVTERALARLRDAGRLESVHLGDRVIWRLGRQAMR